MDKFKFGSDKSVNLMMLQVDSESQRQEFVSVKSDDIKTEKEISLMVRRMKSDN